MFLRERKKRTEKFGNNGRNAPSKKKFSILKFDEPKIDPI